MPVPRKEFTNVYNISLYILIWNTVIQVFITKVLLLRSVNSHLNRSFFSMNPLCGDANILSIMNETEK